MQKRPTKHRFASMLHAAMALALACSASLGLAGEPHQWLAGTYLDPAIQRPDFFPHTISRSIPEYRQVYNRPRNLTGWIAYKIEPSSQEAMAWQTNHCNGNYQNHAGAYVPMYCYPKPWESLNTRGRPGSQHSGSAASAKASMPASSAQMQSEMVSPAPVDVGLSQTVPTKKLKEIPGTPRGQTAPLGIEVPPPSTKLK